MAQSRVPRTSLFVRIAVALLACAILYFIYYWSSSLLAERSQVFTIHKAAIKGGVLSVLVEFSETTIRKDIGDLVFAGRGTNVSTLTAYGVVPVSLHGETEVALKIEYLAVEAEGRSFNLGLSGDGKGVLASYPGEKWIACIPDLYADLRCVDLYDRRELLGVISGRGETVFHSEKNLWNCVSHSGEWLILGCIPADEKVSLHGEIRSRDRTKDNKGFVCSKQGVICTWNSHDQQKRGLSGYSLESGERVWRIDWVEGADFVGICGFRRKPLVGFLDTSSRSVKFLDMTGETLAEAMLPVELLPGGVVAPYEDSSGQGFILVSGGIGMKGGLLQVCKVKSTGESSMRTFQVRGHRPRKSVPRVPRFDP